MYDIITIGHLLRDVFLFVPPGIEASVLGGVNEFSFKPEAKYEMQDITYDLGGTACNVAVGIAKLGFRSALVAKVGTDSQGKQLVQELKQHKVSSNFIVKDHQHKTGLGLMLVGIDGTKTALVYSGASKNLKISDVPLTKLKSRWLFLSSLEGDLKMLERIITSAKKQGVKVAYDFGQTARQLELKNLLPIFRNLDLLIINRRTASELVELTTNDIKVLFASLIVTTPGLVVVTDGERGSYLSGDIEEEEAIYFAPVLRDKLVDTSGADSALAAGFLAGLLKYEDKLEALKLATINVSQVVGEIGTQAGLLKRWPSKNQLDKIRISKL